MCSKIKPFIIEKVVKRTIKNNISTKLLVSNVVYKHEANIFSLNVSNFEEPKICEEKVFDINRNVFIKSVIDGIKDNNPQVVVNTKKVVIDFSSPNIAKPFHVGHLRSTIIGNFIANINKYFHNNVVKLNYLGDWGTQFGLLQYGLNCKKIEIDKIKDDPIRNLYEIYVEMNKLSSQDENIQNEARKYFTNIENGKTDLKNWKKICEITIQELKRVYNRLGIEFDEYHWESNYNSEAIKDIIKQLEIKNILLNDESGKKIAKVNNRNVTLLKSDNSTLYLTRDIAALLDRYQRFKFDKMLYVVDNAQTDHFAAVFDIVSRTNKECTNGCEHIKFGRIKGMSTRKGNVIFLNDILDEAKQKMYDKQQQSKNTRTTAMNDQTCDTLGTTAVIINDLKQRRQKDYVFDWERALQSEGDSGIKLQYLHCRLWSLEQNSGVPIPELCQPEFIPEEIAGTVVLELVKFEEILYRAYMENEACLIVNYLFRLAKHVNKMFNELKVKNADPDIGAQRLLLFNSSRLVIKTCLEILGVKPLYEM